MHSSLRKKYIGNAAFYKMALAVAVPLMIQNGITNFVSLLDNIMLLGLHHAVEPLEVGVERENWEIP